MSNKTQAQLLKSAATAINTNTADEAKKAELLKKTFVFLTLDDIKRLTAPNASVVELAAKIYLAKKSEFLDANVTIGQLAIAMNHFRKGIESQYGFDFKGLKEVVVSEISQHNFSSEEIKQAMLDAYNEMNEQVPEVVLTFLHLKTNEVIDQYYLDHPEVNMKQVKETPTVEVTATKTVVTVEVKPEDLPKDVTGKVAEVILDNTATDVRPLPRAIAQVIETVVVETPATPVVESTPDLSSPRARFLQRMGKAMDKVEKNDKAWGTGSHHHDLNPTLKVDTVIETIGKIEADTKLNEDNKENLLKAAEGLLAYRTKCLVKEDEARASYKPNSFKFNLMNLFGLTVY